MYCSTAVLLHCYTAVLLYWCTAVLLYCCTESVPRQEEGSTGKYQFEVEGVPEGAARENSRDKHYPIYKSDEALAIGIALVMSRAVAMSRPREKR